MQRQSEEQRSMITIDVVLERPSEAVYPIKIGSKILERFGEVFDLSGYSKVVVVVDEVLLDSALPKILKGIPVGSVPLSVSGGETGKVIDAVARLWGAFLNAGMDRRSVVINLGGGAVTDLGGFAASTFMRGVDFIQVPTTLLAQVDASVGGKVGINFGGIKNLVGAFDQPKGVLIDVDTLSTLPRREFLSGFSEIVKHGLIYDSEFFSVLEDCAGVDLDDESLTRIITRSCEIKAAIVASDERETGARKLLNFGHTVGHAIEALSYAAGEPLLHGEAVSIGMVAETYLSFLAGFISSGGCQRVEQCLSRSGLPIRLPFDVSNEELISKMKVDKKNVGGTMRWTLLSSIGVGVYDQHLSHATVSAALDYLRTDGIR
jgi:3-dehydroquinate synthase